MAKQLFPQKCPYPTCGYEWLGKIQFPVSCPRCKQRLDMKRKSMDANRSAALHFVETKLVSAGYPAHIAKAEAKRRLNSIVGFGGK
jgi:hypothetical protein